MNNIADLNVEIGQEIAGIDMPKEIGHQKGDDVEVGTEIIVIDEMNLPKEIEDVKILQTLFLDIGVKALQKSLGNLKPFL